MDCELNICRSSQLSHEICTLFSFSNSMMDREIYGSQKIFYILNKNNIYVELRGIYKDEIGGDEGVRVTQQFINFHVNRHLEPLRAESSTNKMSCELQMQPEKPERQLPELLQITPPKPAQMGFLIQLPSTFRMVQPKPLLFHRTY